MNVNIYARNRICLKGHLRGLSLGWSTNKARQALRVVVAERMILVLNRWRSYLF